MAEEQLALSKQTKRTIVAITLCQAIAVHFLTILKDSWPEIWIQTAFVTVIAVPLFIALVLIHVNDKKMWLVIIAYGVMVLGTSYYTVYQCSGYDSLSCSAEHWFQYAAPQIIAWFIALFFTQVWLSTKDFSFSYDALIKASWSNYISLKLTLLFLLIFAGLLSLWAALFNIIGINQFAKLFSHPWFMFPVAGIMLGVAIINFRERINTVHLVLNILQVLMQWLLPIVSLMSILFLLTLPFTGLDGLWDTGYATGMMLWIISLLLFFSNAVYLVGNNDTQHSKFYNVLIKVSLILSPVYVGLASAGLMIRVNEYGWTVGRLWVLIIILLLASFTLSYSYSLITKRNNWFYHITRINRILAVCIVIVCILVTSPVIDLRKISVTSQLSLLHQGKISIEDFDYKYLRFKTGRAGHQALLSLKDYEPIKNNSEQLAYIDNVLAASSQWNVKAKDSGNAQALKALIRMYPQGTEMPEALLVELFKNKNNYKTCKKRNDCFILAVDVYGDEAKEYIFNLGPRYLSYSNVYALSEGQWMKIGGSMATKRLNNENIDNALLQNNFMIKPSAWKALVIDGINIEFSSNK